MKTSFKKNIQKKQEPLTFFGHPEFDAILGNSLKKGLLVLLEEDYPTTLHISFERYFVGCAFHLNQQAIIYDVFDKKWSQLVPGKSSQSQKAPETDKVAQQNQIAWRYNQQQISTSELEKLINPEIPKLDLAKTVAVDESKQQKYLTRCINEFSNLKDLYLDLCASLQNSLSSEKDTEQRKILVTNLFSHFSQVKITDAPGELAQFLQSLKVLLRSSHAVLLLTIPPDLDLKLKNLLYFYFDMVLRIQSFPENKQYSEFNGFFHLLKLPQINSFLNYSPDHSTWGIKAKSKSRLEIDRLYESPCEELIAVQPSDQCGAPNQF